MGAASSPVNYMSILEFRDSGFLQEVNRRILHPCGVALEIVSDQPDFSGDCRLGGVWDYRDDPEGLIYGPDMISQTKIETVNAMLRRHHQYRMTHLGYFIQPS